MKSAEWPHIRNDTLICMSFVSRLQMCTYYIHSKTSVIRAVRGPPMPMRRSFTFKVEIIPGPGYGHANRDMLGSGAGLNFLLASPARVRKMLSYGYLVLPYGCYRTHPNDGDWIKMMLV